MSLMDLLSGSIGPEQIKQIAGKIGASPEQTESAIGLALPTLLGALSSKGEDETACKQLHEQFQQSETTPIAGLLGGGSGGSILSSLGNAGGLLEGLLGKRQSTVENGIGQASGLNTSQVGSLLGMLAPMILGAAGEQTRSKGLDLGGLMGMLQGEKKQIQQQASGGMLAGLLDQDGDGDFDLKDVLSLGMKMLRRK